jgi:hypothetical protein
MFKFWVTWKHYTILTFVLSMSIAAAATLYERIYLPLNTWQEVLVIAVLTLPLVFLFQGEYYRAQYFDRLAAYHFFAKNPKEREQFLKDHP